MRCPESHYELQSDAHCATRYSNKHLGPILDMNGYGGEGVMGGGLLVGIRKHEMVDRNIVLCVL